MKVRKVDFYPDEWLAGAMGLKADQRGCYITVIMLIYSYGGTIEDDERELAHACNVTRSRWRAIRQELLSKGKIALTEDGKLTNRRCESELEKSSNRIQNAIKNAQKGGRKSSDLRQKRTAKSNENNEITEADASNFSQPNYQLPTTNHQPRETEISELELRAEQVSASGSAYAFEGRKIRLKPADLDRWRQAYSAIVDIRAELTAIDDWLAANRPKLTRSQAFHAASGMLRTKHNETLEKRKSSKPLTASSRPAWERHGNRVMWQETVHQWVVRPDRGWPDVLGPTPDSPGFIGPPELALSREKLAQLRGAA